MNMQRSPPSTVVQHPAPAPGTSRAPSWSTPPVIRRMPKTTADSTVARAENFSASYADDDQPGAQDADQECLAAERFHLPCVGSGEAGNPIDMMTILLEHRRALAAVW